MLDPADRYAFGSLGIDDLAGAEAQQTISRELKRNSGVQVGYKPAYADEQAWARRWRGV